MPSRLDTPHPQLDHALVVVGAVRRGAGGDQDRRVNRDARINRHREHVAPAELAGRGDDPRSRALEQVGRRVDLGGVRELPAAIRLERILVVAGRPHLSVRQQKRRRVIAAILDLGRAQAPLLGGGVVQLHLPALASRVDRVLLVDDGESGAPADHDLRAVGQQDRVLVGAGEVQGRRRSASP